MTNSIKGLFTKTHFTITQASITAVVGNLIVWAGTTAGSTTQHTADRVHLATAVVSSAFLLANAVHAFIATKATPEDVKAGVEDIVNQLFVEADFKAPIQDALKGVPFRTIVQNELNVLLGTRILSPIAAEKGQGVSPAFAVTATPSGIITTAEGVPGNTTVPPIPTVVDAPPQPGATITSVPPVSS